MTEYTGRSMKLDPQFHYSAHVEMIKRFVEQLTAHSGQLADDQVRYVEANLSTIRSAVSTLLSDDIEQQITKGEFPLRYPVITFHDFEPMESDPDICDVEDCYMSRNIPAHTL